MFHNEFGPWLILSTAARTHDGNTSRDGLDTSMFIMEHSAAATNTYCTILLMKLDLGWIVLGRAGMSPDGNTFGELVVAWIVLGRASTTPDGNRFG